MIEAAVDGAKGTILAMARIVMVRPDTSAFKKGMMTDTNSLVLTQVCPLLQVEIAFVAPQRTKRGHK
jgi:hypothetical protein